MRAFSRKRTPFKRLIRLHFLWKAGRFNPEVPIAVGFNLSRIRGPLKVPPSDLNGAFDAKPLIP